MFPPHEKTAITKPYKKHWIWNLNFEFAKIKMTSPPIGLTKKANFNSKTYSEIDIL